MNGSDEHNATRDLQRTGHMAAPVGRHCVPPADWHRVLQRGALGAFVVMVAGAVLGFIAHLVVARLVGKAEYGIYALMLSWISVLSVIAQAGQDTSVVRFVPGYIARGEWGKVRGLRLGVGALVLAISITISLAGCAFVYLSAGDHSVSWRATFYIGFAMLPILTQLQQSSAMHCSFKRAVASGVYTTVIRAVALIGLLLLWVMFGSRIDAPVAAAASGIAVLLALGMSAAHLAKAWPAAGNAAPATYDMRRWVQMGAKLSLLSIITVVGNRLDVIVVGVLIGADRVGPYYAAVQLAGFALYGGNAVNVILAPMIAERYDVGDVAGMQGIARRAARIGVAVALGTAIVFAAIGHWILSWFGAGFEVGYLPMLILLAGYVLMSLCGQVGFMMSMTRYQAQASKFVAIGILLNVATAYLLIPRFGIVGAAAGAAVSIIAWKLLALRFVIRRLKINPSVLGSPVLASAAS